jgi:tRNA(fMet)-specific endonuclease VapC
MDLIADTTLLVGLWRGQAWATGYATANSERSIGLSWVVLGEFWHGALRSGHDASTVRSFLRIGIPLTDAAPFVEAYAEIAGELQRTGNYAGIGQNDIWIAATAKTLGVPLVTRNRRHFDKIDGVQLEVLAEA